MTTQTETGKSAAALGDGILQSLGIPTPGQGRYAMGYSDVFLELLQSRDAGRNAHYLLPHLRPGMKLLDLGCGPGSITVGLAEAVAPGRVVALDRDPGQLELAMYHADECGVDNIDFRQGNAMDLPFGAESFNAVHCHGFLMHSPDVRRQVADLRRVLRRGGIMGAREMDVSSSFISPASKSDEIFGMLAQVVRLEGGDPLRGRHLKALFSDAGLEGVHAGHSADFFDSPRERNLLAELLLEWGLSREFIRMTGHTGAEQAAWREQVQRWREHPGAVGCFHFGHATGRKG